MVRFTAALDSNRSYRLTKGWRLIHQTETHAHQQTLNGSLPFWLGHGACPVLPISRLDQDDLGRVCARLSVDPRLLHLKAALRQAGVLGSDRLGKVIDRKHKSNIKIDATDDHLFRMRNVTYVFPFTGTTGWGFGQQFQDPWVFSVSSYLRNLRNNGTRRLELEMHAAASRMQAFHRSVEMPDE